MEHRGGEGYVELRELSPLLFRSAQLRQVQTYVVATTIHNTHGPNTVTVLEPVDPAPNGLEEAALC